MQFNQDRDYMKRWAVVDGNLMQKKSYFVENFLAAILIVALVWGAIALVVAVYGPKLS